MRYLLGLLLVGAILWTGWWALAGFGMRQAIDAWLVERRAEGWQAEVSALDAGGFPSTIETSLRNLALADPETGVAVSLDPLVVSASAVWPGDVTIRLPDSPMQFSAPDAKSTLTLQNGRLSIELHAGTDLELESLRATSNAWEISGPAGAMASAEALEATMVQAAVPTDYAITVAAPGVMPGPALRAQIAVPADWPIAFDALSLSADVTFDQPWSRAAIEEQRPQPRAIDLHLAEAAWGDLRLAVAADLTIGADGAAEGLVSVQARNWSVMLDLAEQAQLLPTGLRDQAEWVLSSLANASGNPETIDVQLSLSGGFIRLGLIPLA
ncbi:MAG: DUF2125 domain-containing protein, partial [Pseudomonadota bacterium]